MRGALLAASLTLLPQPPLAAPRFGAPFGDHGVLQRGLPLLLWGEAAPGEALTVTLGQASASAKAAADGHWTVTLPALDAGGPYRLAVRNAAGEGASLSDIAIGDVWLCSGQSNMALPVSRTLDSRSELEHAADDGIRLLDIPVSAPLSPQAGFAQPVAWRPADRDSVADFSAACFYTARELRKTHKVAMGLIASALGGSKIQAWLDEPRLRALGGFDAGLAVLASRRREATQALPGWAKLWEGWWRGTGRDAPWRADYRPGADWKPVPSFTAWETWGDSGLAAYNGMVWYRTDLTLDAAHARAAEAITLGRVDEVDQVWVNGRLVGTGSGAGDLRRYPLPPGLLHAGANSITVNALDTYADGGMTGPAGELAIRLTGGGRAALPPAQWRYLPVGDVGQPPRLPWEPTAGLGVLANGMIAPLGPLGLAGVIWYQGESDTDGAEAEHYQARLAALMGDWRERFRNPALPFLIVQLANYGAPSTRPVESGWARLRDQQRLATAADPHAALAVAIDIGERTDIHPANKQELARRLARAADHLVYGNPAPPSGPQPRDAERQGDSVTVRFVDVTQGLRTYSSDRPVGFELCGAGGCHYAEAAVEGNRVRLADGGQADRIRYCWADSPICTLYDGAGLPATPFELRIAGARPAAASDR